MRVLSARIAHARRDRRTGRVEAVVALTVLLNDDRLSAFVRISAPARAPGAASLRARLLGAAKLAFAADPRGRASRRAA